MYEELLKINMLLTECNEEKKIVIDNEKKVVSYDKKSRAETKEALVDFLDKFFRVLRKRISTPERIEPYTDKGYMLRIRIVEKENKFDYLVKGNSFDELDDFYDILNWIRK